MERTIKLGGQLAFALLGLNNLASQVPQADVVLDFALHHLLIRGLLTKTLELLRAALHPDISSKTRWTGEK